MCVCVCERDMMNVCGAGPLPKTVVDFWRLVWQERAPTIIMITNLVEGTKIKCQQYWPDSGAQTYGPFQVSITEQTTLADYTIRGLLVQVCVCVCVCVCVRQFHTVCVVWWWVSMFHFHCSAEGEFREATESDSVSLHSLA